MLTKDKPVDSYKKYLVSSDLSFISKKKWLESNINDPSKVDTIGVYNKKKKEVYVFNYLIGSLLKKFKKPKSAFEVLNEFKNKFNLMSNSENEKVIDLFNDLVDKKLLVDADILEHIKGNKSSLLFYKPGSFIDDYIIVKRLNTHEYLQVYLAKDQSNKKVVIKLYPLLESISKEQINSLHATLYREITILSYFQSSKYVNKIIAYQNTNNYAILDYINGKSLKQLAFYSEGIITYKKAIHIIFQLIEFMEYLHKFEYIHGDFHDNNIVLDKNLNVNIIDFGLSMHASEENILNIRKGGIHVFLPPERIQNNVFKYIHKNPTLQSDIYQLGVNMYLLLYGCYPFKDESWKQKTDNILNNNILYKKITASNEKIPNELISLLKKCLAKERENRIYSGVELAKEWLAIQDKL